MSVQDAAASSLRWQTTGKSICQVKNHVLYVVRGYDVDMVKCPDCNRDLKALPVDTPDNYRGHCKHCMLIWLMAAKPDAYLQKERN